MTTTGQPLPFEEAPRDKVWQCPDCPHYATTATVAGWHAHALAHNTPLIQARPDRPAILTGHGSATDLAAQRLAAAGFDLIRVRALDPELAASLEQSIRAIEDALTEVRRAG